MLNERILNNTWAARDLCQGVCCELDNISTSSFLAPKEKEEAKNAYDLSRRLVDELTEMGFFNKTNTKINRKQVLKILTDVATLEEKSNSKVQKIWAKETTPVVEFNQSDFKLCVKRLSGDLNQLEEVLTQKLNEKTDFYDAQLISNQNIVLSPAKLNDDSLPFGLVFGVGEKSFVMASDESSLVSLKQKDYEVDNMQTQTFGDLKVCLKGYGCKIKTPRHIIQKNKKESLFFNNSAVVLDARYTKPTAIFCYDYGIKKINLQKRKLSFIAKKLNMSLITISLPKFYKNNPALFVSNATSRKVFNNLVDIIAKDLNFYCKFDFFNYTKKLIGLNTNLRYNFFYKFALNLNSLFEDKKMTEGETAAFIVDMFLKSVERHNLLTKRREKENGAPLYFPGEETPIALPSDFLKGH